MSSSRPTSGSMSRGTARSTITIGRRRRCRVARSTMPRPRIGKVLAVQETTTSNSARRSGKSAKRIEEASNRVASMSARSKVRLATVIMCGCLAAKCVAQSSIISPAPIKSTLVSERLPNTRSAKRTAAAASDTDCSPMAVVVRTSLATEKVLWKSWCSNVPRAPASSAVRTAPFI